MAMAMPAISGVRRPHLSRMYPAPRFPNRLVKEYAATMNPTIAADAPRPSAWGAMVGNWTNRSKKAAKTTRRAAHVVWRAMRDDCSVPDAILPVAVNQTSVAHGEEAGQCKELPAYVA